MESENKTAESLEENESKENQDVDELCEQLIIKLNSLVFFWPYDLLTNLACSRLLDIDFVSVLIKMQKKNLANIQQVNLTLGQ